MKILKQTAFAVLTFSLFVSINTGRAQNTSFNLSDYKNPKYFYHSLDVGFNLDNNLSRNHEKSSYESNSFQSSLHSQVMANYQQYANSARSQTEKNISINFGLGSSRNKYANERNESKFGSLSFADNLNLSGTKRFYNENQYFFEVGGALAAFYQLNASSSKRFDSTGTATLSQTSRSKTSNGNLSVSLFAGKGRIEQVQDARLALYVLDDLKRLGKIQREVSGEEVIQLAELMTKLKYKRFFDNRLRKIAEITVIDSFMQAKNFSGRADAAYFTTLNDNWLFLNNPARLSGQRFFAGIESAFVLNHHSYHNEVTIPSNEEALYRNFSLSKNIFAVAGIISEKPLNLKWQRSISFKAGIGVSQLAGNSQVLKPVEGEKVKTYTQGIPSTQVDAGIGFGYYPTSRTWLTANWWLLAGYEEQGEGTTAKDEQATLDNFYLYSGPSIQAYYYLSERLRLSFTINGEFRFDKTDFLNSTLDTATSRWWNQSMHIALSYNLF